MDTLEHHALVLQNGRIIDSRYKIVEKVGEGGFASVYRAEHTKLKRDVALKVLELPEVPTHVDAFLARFMREAQLIAGLKHPSIITVHDFGVLGDSGRPYIAMEFLDGHDLETELYKIGPLSPARALRIFRQALDALSMAHAAGIVHKDLKPSNLYLQYAGTPEERVMLLDFGVAGLMDEVGGRLTATGGFVGTPAYLAPEYIEFGAISPKVDVYQMGLVLIESLMGRPAVVAHTMPALLLKHAQGHVDLPPDFGDHPKFGPVIRRALSLDPASRYADARAFREGLLSLGPEDIIVPAEYRDTRVGFAGTIGQGVSEIAETAKFEQQTPNVPQQTLDYPAGNEETLDHVLISIPSGSQSIPVEALKKSPSRSWALLLLLFLLAAGIVGLMMNKEDVVLEPLVEDVSEPTRIEPPEPALPASVEAVVKEPPAKPQEAKKPRTDPEPRKPKKTPKRKKVKAEKIEQEPEVLKPPVKSPDPIGVVP